MSGATRINMLLEMLNQDPNDAFLLYALSLERMKRGEQGEAIGLLKSLMEKDPDYLPAYYQLGQFYEQAGQFEEAKACYSDGIILAKQQGNQKAVQETREALALLDD